MNDVLYEKQTIGKTELDTQENLMHLHLIGPSCPGVQDFRTSRTCSLIRKFGLNLDDEKIILKEMTRSDLHLKICCVEECLSIY